MKAKRRRCKLFLPSISVGNVRSLGNKADELNALIGTQRDLWACNVQIMKADRDAEGSGRKKGGGVALCVTIDGVIRDSVNVPIIFPGNSHSPLLLMFTSRRLRVWKRRVTSYSQLSRDFRHPDSFIAISGDFNHVSLYSSTKIPPVGPLCNQGHQRAGSSVCQLRFICPSPLGRLDANLVLLTPTYW